MCSMMPLQRQLQHQARPARAATVINVVPGTAAAAATTTVTKTVVPGAAAVAAVASSNTSVTTTVITSSATAAATATSTEASSASPADGKSSSSTLKASAAPFKWNPSAQTYSGYTAAAPAAEFRFSDGNANNGASYAQGNYYNG